MSLHGRILPVRASGVHVRFRPIAEGPTTSTQCPLLDRRRTVAVRGWHVRSRHLSASGRPAAKVRAGRSINAAAILDRRVRIDPTGLENARITNPTQAPAPSPASPRHPRLCSRSAAPTVPPVRAALPRSETCVGARGGCAAVARPGLVHFALRPPAVPTTPPRLQRRLHGGGRSVPPSGAQVRQEAT